MIGDNLTKMRYEKVLAGLLDNWLAKLILSAISSGLAIIGNLVETEPFLIVAVILAMVGDVITGLVASYRRKTPITSLGLRQFAAKVVEYAVVLLFFTIMSNTFAVNAPDNWIGTPLSLLENVHYLAYFYCFYTEGLSIYENLTDGNSRVAEIFEYVKDKINDKLKIDGE